MSNNSLTRNPVPGNQQPQVIDLRKLFFRIISYWYFFVLTLIVAIICAWLYNRYTTTTYRVSSTLLIEQDTYGYGYSRTTGSDKLLEGFGLRPGMQNLDNQIQILTSWSLIGKTVDSLPFETEYYIRGRIKKAFIYPVRPVTIIQSVKGLLPGEVEFRLKYLDKSRFHLSTTSGGSFTLSKEASFGEKIEVNGGSFRIECPDDRWFINNKGNDLYFIFHSHEFLLGSYKGRLKVEPATRDATVVKLTLQGYNREMDMDFLNKLATVFLNYNLDKKNEEATRTIDFINKQLTSISDSLNITEGNLQKFKSKNMVMNLSAQGQIIIDQAMKLENEKARLVIESNYFNYLSEYLHKDNIGEVPIAPATMGITEPGLTRLVTELADLQGQYYSKSLGDKNPLQGLLGQRLQNNKEALQETLKGVKRANELALRENSDQMKAVNEKAAALPVTERNLLGFERQFKLNDVLYTFLLEKKSEAQVQKASNTPDNEIIDPARSDGQVSPKTRLSYIIALLAGLAIPVLFILLIDAFSFRIRDEEDIKEITDLSIAGHIPHSLSKMPHVVLDEPQSNIAESFRALRSKMQFFTKQKLSPVILITSSMPAEGKTFTAMNLASAYSLMGMKTVLIGFDLRKPKIYGDFGIDNEQGVSTWLIGRDKLDDIIKSTTQKNLFVIPAGPIPPNPSELTASANTDELIKLLREKFDCIIIDSPPIGSVSDTYHIAGLADVCLLIIRQNTTLKDMLERTINDIKQSNIKSISLLVNDIAYNDYRYGYGGKYGYGYGYGYSYGNGKKNREQK